MHDKPVAIVTASSRGIGAAAARRLREQGHELVLLATSDKVHEVAAELGGIAVQGSMIDSAALDKVVDLAARRYGRLDALVISSGHPPRGELAELSDEQWQDGFDLLLMSVVRLCRRAAPVMIGNGGGSIVAISAYGAAEPQLDFPISSVIRAGLSGYVKLFATRYAADGIRMNSVLPGYFDSYPENAESVATIPAGRYGRVSELADLIAYLVSPASAYVTGQNIAIDGGLVKGLR